MNAKLASENPRTFITNHQLHFTNNMLPYEQNTILLSGMPPRWEQDVLQRQKIRVSTGIIYHWIQVLNTEKYDQYLIITGNLLDKLKPVQN